MTNSDSIDVTLTELGAQIADLQNQLTAAQERATSLTWANGEQAGTISQLRAQILDLEHQLDVALNPVETLAEMDLYADGVTIGQATAASLGKAWGQPGKLYVDANWKNFQILSDADGARFLRWTSLRNTAGSSYGVSGPIPFLHPADDVTTWLTFRLSPGFGISAGLKLPGIHCNRPGESGTRAGGGTNPGTIAASRRIMLAGAKMGTFPQPDGTKYKAQFPIEATSYIYEKDKTEQERFWKVNIPTGQKIHTRCRDLMNDVGQANGSHEAWMAIGDGPELQVRDDQGEEWRFDPAVQPANVFDSEFRGGPNNDLFWADNDEVPDFIDIFSGFKVTTPRAA